jgi:hypothetical protein
MNLISTFRQQHDQIEQVASDISRHLDTERLATDASYIRQKLRNLLIRLKIHNSLEADSLHVNLQHHENRLIATEASRLMGEAASMTEELEQYRRYWLKTGVIEDRPDVFIEETKALLTALHDRFNRENSDLFNRVEREIMH